VHSASAGHPPYSPDLAPSDFHLFPTLKEFLGVRLFKSNEVNDSVKQCLNGLVVVLLGEFESGAQSDEACYYGFSGPVSGFFVQCQ